MLKLNKSTKENCWAVGLFNFIMKGIGFESEEVDEEQEEERKLSFRERRALKKAKKQRRGQELDDNFNCITDFNSGANADPNSFAMNRDQFNTVTPDGMGRTGVTQTYNPYGSYNQKNFVFFTPKNYEDVKKLIEYLKQTEPAIVNLDAISDNEAQRILDFISGGVCALNGSIQRIKGNIFLVAPDGFNIMISRDQLEKISQ